MNNKSLTSILFAIGVLLTAPLSGEEKTPASPLLPELESLVKAGASWAMRIDVDESFKTPLTFIVSARGTTNTISTYRFLNRGRTKRVLDLSHHMTVPLRLNLPKWLFELKKSDGVGGLDGSTTHITIHYEKNSHKVTRWTPRDNASGRDLEQYVKLIDQVIQTSGIQARPVQAISFDLVEFTLPVPNEFLGAADMLKRHKGMTAGQVLEKSFAYLREGSKIHFDLNNRTLTGKLERDASISLQSFVAGCFLESESSIYEKLLNMLPDKNIKDPFATGE